LFGVAIVRGKNIAFGQKEVLLNGKSGGSCGGDGALYG
jgi:hypothetical protein